MIEDSPAGAEIDPLEPTFDTPKHVGGPNVEGKAEFLQMVEAMLETRWLTNNGPLVQEFEASVSKFLGVKNCVATCNGTIALELAIRALELEGEVIVPSYTFVATAHALSWQGLTPVFADIDPLTHCIDPVDVQRKITTRTTGIIGVHLWGRAAPVLELDNLAKKWGLKVLYDSAHAFGCSYGGTMLGNFGSCEVLSFHATKYFNTFEGGAVVTNDDQLAEKIRLMRNFGFSGYDNVIYPGTNGKMTEICAAMGLANLKYLDRILDRNKKNYESYRHGLSSISGLGIIEYSESERCNYQYIVVEVDDSYELSRDGLVELLHSHNILARKYFWPGCHAMMPYTNLYPDAGRSLPATEAVANRVIVLPTGSSMSTSDIEKVLHVLARRR